MIVRPVATGCYLLLYYRMLLLPHATTTAFYYYRMLLLPHATTTACYYYRMLLCACYYVATLAPGTHTPNGLERAVQVVGGPRQRRRKEQGRLHCGLLVPESALRKVLLREGVGDGRGWEDGCQASL